MVLTHKNNYELLEADNGKYITNGNIYTKWVLMPTTDFNFSDWSDVDNTPTDELVSDREVINLISAEL